MSEKREIPRIMNLESIAGNISDYLISPLLSTLKVAIRSGRPSAKPSEAPRKPLIIMGNGPSLRSFLDFARTDGDAVKENFDLEAVNFAAITPEFFELKPDSYILADPHFFRMDSGDAKVGQLWANLQRCDWPMTLWIPRSQLKTARERIRALPENVSINLMNLTPVEGRGPLADLLLDAGLGMPRPRNVLIPAIMAALRSGYRKIYLVGADHSWSRTLWVDDNNHVVSVQPHFYKDDEKERKRVESEYAGYHLHDILNSLTVAFRSYFDIRRYASRIGAEIINATPESFIDAFPRCGYGQMMPQSGR